MKKIHYLVLSFIIVVGLAGIGLRTNVIKLPIIKKGVLGQLAYNPNDNKELVGIASNIFVGKILRQIGTGKDDLGSLYTQFEVETIDNIKGNLTNTVTVTQMAGYKNGILYTMEEDGDGLVELTDKKNDILLLQPGSTYLMVTRHNENFMQYALLTVLKSRTLISNDKNLDNIKLKDLASVNEAVKKLRIAYTEEILFAPSVSAGNTKNSFISLPTEEQEKLKAEAEKYKKELNIPDYEPTPARQNIIPEVLQQDIDAHPESQLPQAVQ